MSLYHEASQVLTSATEDGGSLKSIIFGKKDWKSDPRVLYALTTEAAKWSEILSEVIEKSDLLKIEKQLSPILSLVLAHDLLLSKKGVALPAKHGLYASVSRHKARLTSELTKARLRRGCSSLEALRGRIDTGGTSVSDAASGYVHPRWIRINTILTTLEDERKTTFADFERVSSLSAIADPSASSRPSFYVDPHIPDLIAVSGACDLSSSKAYKEGRLIFQEQASCFPAYLLDPASTNGDIIDACAAPGNKTTQLAALMPSQNDRESRKLFACEKDPTRSQTLQRMVKLAGAGDVVTVRVGQDFLKLNPQAPQFHKVGALLLDPSCSGSGIIGRDEASIKVHLPSREAKPHSEPPARGKKRKRGGPQQQQQPQPAEVRLKDTTATDADAEEQESPGAADEDETRLAARLAKLSSFQLRLLEHAMSFPAARRITYSTCSLHKQENEHVVGRALLSSIAKDRAWRVLRRDGQVEGLRAWELRGSSEAVGEVMTQLGEKELHEVAEACIRCEKGGEGGTMGFFVCGLVREDASEASNGRRSAPEVEARGNGNGRVTSDEEDAFEGFSDGGS